MCIHFNSGFRVRQVYIIKMSSFLINLFVLFICCCIATCAEVRKCKIPPAAPKNIEKVINVCQDEIRFAILSEALQVFNFDNATHTRVKRDAFSDDEKRIAGCLLHCVYRRMDALNKAGFPTIEGLVNLYAQGVKDRGYLMATLQSVALCLNDAEKKHLSSPQSLKENGKTCSVAFDVFSCVSDRIGNYCGQTP